MGPVILLVFCFMLILFIPIVLFLFTYIFRQACVWCGLPKPSVATAAGVMFLIRVSTLLCEAVMDLLVTETCRIAGLPPWDTGIVIFFLILPIDLLISAALHSGLMNIRFGKGIEVWFVQWLIILSIFAAITFLAALIALVLQLNG